MTGNPVTKAVGGGFATVVLATGTEPLDIDRAVLVVVVVTGLDVVEVGAVA